MLSHEPRESTALTESELRARLAAEGLDASAWSNGPGDRNGAHAHGYDKVIVVASGSITFGLPGAGRSGDVAGTSGPAVEPVVGDRLELAVGDRLELPAGTRHDAVVGPSGVVCLEAHAPAGRLAGPPLKVPAGSW